MNEESKKSETSKSKQGFSLFSIISEAAQLLIIIALIVVAALSFGSRVSALSRLGVRFFAVTSGSMEPTIPTGSMLLVDTKPTSEIAEGDIITYQKTNPNSSEPSIVTHRIDSIEHTERQREYSDPEIEDKDAGTVQVYEFKTKGDANQDPDNYTVLPGEILGVYQWHVPKVGYLINHIQSPKGFISFVIIPAMILIIWESVSLILNIREWLEKRKQGKNA